MTTAPRSLLAALVAACLMLAVAGEAAAQVSPGEETSTTTSTTFLPDDTIPAAPSPEESAPTTSVPESAPTTSVVTEPDPTTTTSTPPPAPPAAEPPSEGGDAAAPPGAPPAIPPEVQAKIDSVVRTRSSSTARLLEALAPLRAMGMTEPEAVQAAFGRFPVAGRATFSDDWWFPRFGPAIGQVRLHEGTDIFAPYGTPVRAPANGVLKQTFNRLGGLSAYVHQPDATYFYLAHLSRYEVGQISGQKVKAGDVIGYVGDSGNARGSSPHVHFEIHPHGGGPINPKPVLDGWIADALKAVPEVAAEAAPRLAERPRAAAAVEEQDLTVVGHTDLGGRGRNGKVTVVGTTALVARGFSPPGAEVTACDGSVTVVDLSDPTSPKVAATIDIGRGQRVGDLDALNIRTPSFSGDLAAVAVVPCDGAGTGGVTYYDVTNRERPRLLARVAHPRELAPAGPGAGTCVLELRGTCQRAGSSVQLRRADDATVVSVASSAAAGTSPAQVHAVDVSRPEEPVVLGLFPVPGTNRGPRAAGSDDRCSPVSLTRSRDREGALPGMFDVTGFRWDVEPRFAARSGRGGSDTYPVVVETATRRLALVSDDHWWSSTWALKVDPPASLAGDKLGCPGPITGAGTDRDGPAGPTAGRLAYVGRGCPERRGADGSVVPADPYLADPTGKIAVADAALEPVQRGLPALGCNPGARLARARRAGALGLVLGGSFLAEEHAPSPGESEEPQARSAAGADSGAVPGLQLTKPDGDALRDALCPTQGDAKGCSPGQTLDASMVEMPGQWGGLRVVDVTDPEGPRQIQVYRTANAAAASPAEPGTSYAVHAAVADGSRVYTAWGSDGLRVIDLAGGSPVEVASFLPPAGAGGAGAASVRPLVTGVDETSGHIVVSDLTSGLWVLDKRVPAGTRGYWLADADGGVHAFGDATFAGSGADIDLSAPVVAMDPSPSGRGYRLVTADGGVYAFGDASFAGSLAGTAHPSPVVGTASTPTGRGYWLTSADGGVYAFGDAPFLGSLAATPPTRPIVDVVASPTGGGYWLVGDDGAVFAFGDADFLGSTAAAPPARPIVAAAATPSGDGYWLAADDGGVFAFGDARFKGSMAGVPVPSPIVGLAPMTGVKGYWLADAEGGVHGLGAPYLGARSARSGSVPIVAVAAVPHPKGRVTGRPNHRER